MGKVSIRLEIDNYEKTSRYRVNLYKENSVIPLDTKDLPVNSDRIVYFLDKDDAVTYEIEVIQFCDNTQTEKSSRKKVFDALTNSCNCPTGFRANTDATKCVRVIINPPTYQGIGLDVAAGPNEPAYCREGIRVYAPGYSQNGTGGVQYASGPTHPYWASLNSPSFGRLNLAGVWNAASASAPTLKWIGFTKYVSIGSKKVYYIGIAGDNYVRIKVNGQVIVDQKLVPGEITNQNFNYWHVYPVQLNAGDNIIELEGWNNDGQACFAAEVYDCDLLVLQNVTTGGENTLNRVFSTQDMIGAKFTDGYRCEQGYALDLSNPSLPVCKKIEYSSCI